VPNIIFPFIALLTSISIINLGAGLQSTLLGMRATYEHFDILETGLVMSSYFLGYIGSSIFTANIINGVGHIRSFAAFASIASAAALCHAVFIDPIIWFILRAITGVCVGGLTMVGESWLNATSSNKNRGSIFSIYMIVVLGAAAVSQLLVNIADISGYDLFVLVSVAMSVSLVPVALGRKISVPELQVSARMRLSKLFANSPLGTIGVFASGLVNGALWSMTAVYAVNTGMSAVQVSWTMTLLIGGGILSMWPVGRLSDYIDRRKVILALSVSSFAVTTVITVQAGGQIFWQLALIALLGMVAFPLYAIAASHTNDFLESAEFVPASSAMILLYGLGAIMAPLLTSFAMHLAGPKGMFLYIAIVNACLTVFVIVRIWQSDIVPLDERGDFVPAMPKVASATSPLDPRNEEAESAVKEAYQVNLDQQELAD